MKYTIALFLTLFFALTAFTASADTLTVTNTNDSGAGSLRFMVANASKGDLIVFAPALAGQTINLQAGITIEKDLSIDGSGLNNMVTLTCSSDKCLAVKGQQWREITVSIKSLKFQGNPKGGVSVQNVDNCFFVANICTEYSNACYAKNIKNSIFLRNKSQSNGGACTGEWIENCYFEGNEATINGGAVLYGRVYNCEFRKNKANKGGAASGGSYFNCTFIKNEAVEGGALHSAYDIYNCSFISNTATKGGAIYGGRRNFNSSFIGNKVTDEGGAILGGGYYSNCLFYGNEATNKGMDVSGSVRSLGGNVVSISGGSSGWLANDDKTGTVSNPLNAMLGDSVRCGRNLYYRLQAGSPALSAGKENYPDSIKNDTATKRFRCYDICGNQRPATCIDAGSYQQSNCVSQFLAGGCDYIPNGRTIAEMNKLSLYPNPTTGRFTLHHSETQTAMLYLYDLTGRVIHTQGLTYQHTELNIENYPAGIYTLKVLLGNGVQVTKIVKE